MRRTRTTDTKPEIKIRRLLHARGLRYRIHIRPVPDIRCRPDIVFTRAKVAVFVDGCFWHSCPIHATKPKANSDWWAQKLDSNTYRDRRNDRDLQMAGWTVVRVWEHELATDAALRIEQQVAVALGAVTACKSPLPDAARSARHPD